MLEFSGLFPMMDAKVVDYSCPTSNPNSKVIFFERSNGSNCEFFRMIIESSLFSLQIYTAQKLFNKARMKGTDNISVNICNSNFLYNISQSNRTSCLIFDLRPLTEIEKTGAIKGSIPLKPLELDGNGNDSRESQPFDLASLIDQEVSDGLLDKLKHLMRNFIFLILSTKEPFPKDPKTSVEEDYIKVKIDDLVPAPREDGTKEREFVSIQSGLEIFKSLQSQKVRELYILGDALESFLSKYPFLSTAPSEELTGKADTNKAALLHYPNEICEQIFLGNVNQVKERSILTTLRITHVLNTAEEVEISPEELSEIGVRYHKLPIKDFIDFNIEKYFEEAYQVISSIIESDVKSNVLVHCARGKCRSVAIVAMYLMKKNQWSFKKAIGFISRKNDSVCLNLGFEETLENFEKGGYQFPERPKEEPISVLSDLSVV